MKRWVLVSLLCAPVSEARVWTSVSGKTLEAEFVEQRVHDVTLRKPDGKKVAIRKSKLSAEDRTHLQQLSLDKIDKSIEVASPIPDHIEKLFGDELLNADKDKVSSAELEGKVLGVYFSAHWCPPCRRFTPKLVKAYQELIEDGEDIEIVFVSSDRSKSAMFEYMEEGEMPWLALPFNSKRRQKLSNTYQVQGIPRLVILNDKGKLLTHNARGQVSARGADAFDKWL